MGNNKAEAKEIKTPLMQRLKTMLHYEREYSFFCVVLLFFAVSFFGWMWEGVLSSFTEGFFANRGVLLGPWLPVYGTGGIAALILLKRLRPHPFWTFFVTAVLSGVVEYFTGWILETFFGRRWWDYSDYMFNIQGRVCLEILVVFGLGCWGFIYIFAPLLAKLIYKIPKRAQIFLSGLLSVIFVADLIHAMEDPNVGRGVTALATFIRGIV